MDAADPHVMVSLSNHLSRFPASISVYFERSDVEASSSNRTASEPRKILRLRAAAVTAHGVVRCSRACSG
jgi:hypothetical protein